MTKMKGGREERLKSHPVKCKLIVVMLDDEKKLGASSDMWVKSALP